MLDDFLPHLSILGEVLLYICLFGISDLIVTHYLHLSAEKKLMYYIALGGLGSYLINTL